MFENKVKEIKQRFGKFLSVSNMLLMRMSDALHDKYFYLFRHLSAAKDFQHLRVTVQSTAL